MIYSSSIDIVFLSVKPQYLMEVLRETRDSFRPTQIVVSIVAGISLPQIADVIGEKKICRVMPNTPCLVSEGTCSKSLATDNASLKGAFFGRH